MSSREITMVVGFHQILNGSINAFYISTMLSEDRQMLLRRWGKFSVFCALVMIFCALLTPYSWPRSIVIMFAIPYFILCCFSKPLKARLFTLFSMLAIDAVLELSTYMVMFMVFDSSAFIHYDITVNSMLMAAGVIVINMLSFLVYVLIIALKKMIMHQMKIKEFLIYIAIPVYQFFALILFLRTYPRLDRTMIYMGTLLFMMSLLLALFVMFSTEHLILRMQAQENLSVLMVKRQEELEYYLQVQKNLNHMRAMKHDFANHLQTLYMLLQSKADIRRVMEFIDSVCLMDGEE